jgi:hypothetical protein
MTMDRETSNHPAPGTPKMSVIQGGKGMQEVSRSGFVISELHKMATNGDIPPAVKVRALELMGKTVALFTDRVETEDTTDRSADEIEAQIKARLGLS